jgi:hypothetical protein
MSHKRKRGFCFRGIYSNNNTGSHTRERICAQVRFSLQPGCSAEAMTSHAGRLLEFVGMGVAVVEVQFLEPAMEFVPAPHWE